MFNIEKTSVKAARNGRNIEIGETRYLIYYKHIKQSHKEWLVPSHKNIEEYSKFQHR